MSVVAALFAVATIVVVANLLLRRLHPHGVLLAAGLSMLVVARGLGLDTPVPNRATGWFGFDLLRLVAESFSETLGGVGLMIMAIGGFVAAMDKLGASHALVSVATRPLRWFRRFPYLSASLMIPIGQALFVTIPSAAGLGLLLMASVYPLLVRLGISRVSAVAVIVSCTSFGMGPASAMTARATEIVELPLSDYFVLHQLPLVVPTSLVVATAFYFVNRWADRKETPAFAIALPDEDPDDNGFPTLYAIFPVLPLVLLLAFSGLFGATRVRLDTTTAMFVSLLIALVVDGLRTRDASGMLGTLKVFWGGMGDLFRSVVTLIIAADVFSQGLLALGFIDALIAVTQSIGMGAVGIGVVMSVMIFAASMLMGSGNASFFAFGPLAPDIASSAGVPATDLVTPMQLAASMGRSVSPIAGVVIATSELAGVSTIDVVRRTAVPLGLGLVFLLVFHSIVG
ncbi:MAG: C4-dicarboxylate transporter DcuC [Myxococcota bacterium]